MSGITRVYRTYEASTPGQLTTMRMKGSSVIPDSPRCAMPTIRSAG